ncbi:MAG: ATP-binding cassette domain-containing protein, partial [Bacteroidetes bacterium]|nr:ATP-binding cassette domain-containing protein [Bacteroidota bacterium]
GRFMFPFESQFKTIKNLSGGERARLALLKLTLGEYNFLILDEPTNDFDIDTLNVLEAYLEAYDGGLLIVSHDRYFLDKLCDKLFVFNGNGNVVDFPGNYTDYRDQKKEAELNKEWQATSKTERQKPKRAGNKLSYNEQREYDGLEGEIEALENKKQELTLLLESGESDHEKLMQWGQELTAISYEIDTKTERWMEFEERLEG